MFVTLAVGCVSLIAVIVAIYMAWSARELRRAAKADMNFSDEAMAGGILWLILGAGAASLILGKMVQFLLIAVGVIHTPQ